MITAAATRKGRKINNSLQDNECHLNKNVALAIIIGKVNVKICFVIDAGNKIWVSEGIRTPDPQSHSLML